MNKRELASNTAVAFLAQGVSMALSVLQSLIVPRLLGLEQYGYWQLFLFYSSYVGFFHLGLNDGVYLINGGKSRENIDKLSMSSQFAISVIYETLISIAVCLIAIPLLGDTKRSFLLICSAFYLIVQNASWFMMYLLQAINETKKSSYTTIVNRLSFLIMLVALIIMRADTYIPFVICYILSACIQLIYAFAHTKEIITYGFGGWSYSIRLALCSISVGIKLMLANIASQLIIGVLRFAIDMHWGVQVFGKLSLSLSLVNFFLAFVTQASMVLFPALRRSGKEEMQLFFRATCDTLGLVFPISYIAYYPIVWLLAKWLPSFGDSLIYFSLLIPICVFDSRMNITCTTMFKVLRKEQELLWINTATTLFCCASILISITVMNSIEFSILSATCAIMLRSIYSEYVITNALSMKRDIISIAEVILTIAFLVLTNYYNSIIACSCYTFLYIVFLIAFKSRFKDIKKIVFR